MTQTAPWHRLGSVADLKKKAPLQQVEVEGQRIALSFADSQFGAVSGDCLHYGGPLGNGTIQDGYIVCPWHHWMFHRLTGEARPGIPAAVPRYELKEEAGDLFINLVPLTQAKHAPHPAHPLSREIIRAEGPLRVAGISTTAMDMAFPRYSTSDALLQSALDHAAAAHGAETRLIRLSALSFRACEGYYSKSASACTWPCSITQMDPSDQLDQVYEALVFWADVVLIATPIRWGNASSLYYKMIERMNCVQNQITIADRVLIRNKVASFIITGGQDNIQAVAGQMLMFFGEIGFVFPQFPFIAHSRGWSAEDMENNVAYVRESAELRQGAQGLVDRAVEMAQGLVASGKVVVQTERGGRKANPI
jgi:multimeric flavodoxin WrbA/nitrite reductase/ring-hydroxylating ferredoxin subunit